MTSVELGEKLTAYNYKPITLLQHYWHIVGINLFALFGIGGGIYRGFSWDWLLVVTGLFVYMNFNWYKKFTIGGANLAFHIHKKGLVIQDQQGSREYLWPELREVKAAGHFDLPDDKPGFMLCFRDGREVMVYQGIEGYKEFYKHLQSIGIEGSDNKLTIFERVDIYGKFID
jgi:hypothetical protein